VGRGKKIVDTSLVIKAAVDFIEEKGYEEFSTRRLAASLRISAMTLYNYFENREAILKEAVLRSFDIYWEGFPGKIEDCFARCGNPLRVYRVLAEHLLQFALTKPNLYRFLFWADLSEVEQDERIGLRYREAFGALESRITDSSKVEEVHNDVYLFEVLANTLAMNVLGSRAGMSSERYRLLVAEGYERLLAHHESIVRE
jgi:AcrR family transcriptional regulator